MSPRRPDPSAVRNAQGARARGKPSHQRSTGILPTSKTLTTPQSDSSLSPLRQTVAAAQGSTISGPSDPVESMSSEGLIDIIAGQQHDDKHTEEFVRRFAEEEGFKKRIRTREQYWCDRDIIRTHYLTCWRGYLERGDPLLHMPLVFKESASRKYGVEAAVWQSPAEQTVKAQVDKAARTVRQMTPIIEAYMDKSNRRRSTDGFHGLRGPHTDGASCGNGAGRQQGGGRGRRGGGRK